ncbi:MAG TPA: hypothetical protein VN087_02810 [Verrucomicrobiae bacterium]|jgi:hypothetical protein|nr:hypothetical protein [Verrucomicrobiae bacterium]
MVSPTSDGSPRHGGWIVLAMLGMVAVPVGITLHTILIPASLQIQSPDPTPHGYTWSLSIFVIPILVIGWWFLPLEGLKIPQRAFWRTIATLVPLGCSLDFFFAKLFLFFPNRGATIRILAPALGEWVPIEEYVFYCTGFIAVLLIYTWADEFWLAAYNLQDYPSKARVIPRLIRFHMSSVIFGVLLIATAIAYKKLMSPSPAGFPGYFTFLVVTAVVPSAAFFPEVKRFINWRALSLTLFIVLLISLFWEATLAVPYGWWGYQSSEMMGLSIGAWSGLPIEAVFVWIAVTYVTTIVFEVMKLWSASRKTVREAFLGASTSSVAESNR